MRFNALTLACGAVGSLALPPLTHATVLTFERNPDFTSDRQFEDTRASSHDEYGDRVGDANTTHKVGANRFEQVAPATNSNENVAGTYYYGDAGGATPNVVVSYPNPEANFGPATPRAAPRPFRATATWPTSPTSRPTTRSAST